MIIPALKEKPYKTEKLLTEAFKHNKLGGKLTADYLWSHLSVHDREVIKARALQAQEKWKKEHEHEHKPHHEHEPHHEHKPHHEHEPHHEHKPHHEHHEAILVDHKLAAILEKLGLGKPEHMKP